MQEAYQFGKGNCADSERKESKMKKVFIDGSAGTTGLRIRERLAERRELELIILDEAVRKDPAARRAALNEADIAFLCLPDAAAVEAVAMVENSETVVIDTSTAHRTAAGWVYGFPELSGQRERVAAARRIANPGCHASGLIALVKPLVERGLLDPSVTLHAFSLTGFSGGGKKMIADYAERNYLGGRQYALGQTHKHLPEVVAQCALAAAPVFSPIVVPHLSGMEVTVQLDAASLRGGLGADPLEAIRDCYRDYYRDARLVTFADALDDGGFIASDALSGRDSMRVGAYGNRDRILLVSLFDNLGKGASGAAIQNMNLALGLDETTGLVI